MSAKPGRCHLGVTKEGPGSAGTLRRLLILRRAHNEWSYEARHVLWIVELRCYPIRLGRGGRPVELAPLAEDAEALAGLAA